MLKRLLSLVLALSLLCSACYAESADTVPDFKGMNDPALLPYIEDTLYQELVGSLNSEEYFVENVSAIYISQEYLDELSFNSQANIFFGYTLAELDEQFQGTKYVFTLGYNNETVVEPFEAFQDNTYSTVLRNVAIGAGVILVCVTVSMATATAAPAVSMIFAMGAKTGTVLAINGAKMGFVSAGILHYIQTGNLEDSFKAGLVAGSEGFKWGAIAGAISGAASEASFLFHWNKLTNISWNEAAQIQRESLYSLEFINSVHSMEEYNIYKEANLVEFNLGNERILLPRDFDFDFVDSKTGLTNLELLSNGYNPVDSSGIKYQWHHVGQKSNSPLALLTENQHQSFYDVLHAKLTDSEVRPGGDNSQWNRIRQRLNKLIAQSYLNE
ncbi:MAG: hypothetical protein IKP72_18635 [Clostridia bacterium]|nr:hypothetical protein [Clostridia bacterium]